MVSLRNHAVESSVYLARQPIYSANREIRAYELLYRNEATDTAAHFQSGDRASAEVMLKAFLEIGLPTVSPDQPVFINHTRHLLTLDPILPPDRCVIEVLEDVAAEPPRSMPSAASEASTIRSLSTILSIPTNSSR
jgi:c-di-GMP-related signal transduction protein